MEELKLLVEMVASLPQMALWVIAFFFIYKVVVIGSIYGVIRFCVGKAHDVMLGERKSTFVFDGLTISAPVAGALKKSIRSIKDDGLTYIHMSDVNHLDRAIKAMKDKEVK